MTQRLERRLTILRGKRKGAFDRDQYYLETAERARAARKTRYILRRMEPMTIVTPRWSSPQRFLDDVAIDLMLGEPAVRCRTLSLAPLEGRTPHQAWSWLVQAVTEFCHLEIDQQGPASRVASRHGFRHMLKELFAQADLGERRCLMIHGLEALHVEALRDLIDVFEDHRYHRSGSARFNLLLAGSVDAPHFEFTAVERLILPDFAEREAIEALVEHRGARDVPRLESLVSMIGGIPAVLETLGGAASESISQIVADRRALWQVLGTLALEVRRACELVMADDALSARVELLGREGPQVRDPATDDALLRAGLVRSTGYSPRQLRTSLRAPALVDLTA